jgi:CelD/BcsL family acetyltransferase involved in cellulose biosynthesis
MQTVSQPSSVLSRCCTLYRSFAECNAFAPEWDRAVETLGGSVYMTFDWCHTWWQFYGAGKELRIFVCYEDEKIVGVLPLYIDEINFGFSKLRVARLVGSNIPPKSFSPAIADACADKLFAEMLQQLLDKDRCDLISFGPVSTSQNTPSLLEEAAAKNRNFVGACEVLTGVHSVFHFPPDMEQYYASLSKNERKNRRKYELRMLEKEYAVRVDVLSDPAKCEEEFDRFAVQHARQWRAEGKTGHFGAWPRALEYNRALVRAQAKHGRMRFIRILANDHVIANQYTFAFGDTYYWELPSRDIDPQWERFSLGPTGIVTMIACGIIEGKKRLEGGLAHYDYKIRLGAVEYPTKTLRIVSSRPQSMKRFRTFLKIRRVLEIVYHKIWYRRISPKLPPKLWRPQSMHWLRYDF